MGTVRGARARPPQAARATGTAGSARIVIVAAGVVVAATLLAAAPVCGEVDGRRLYLQRCAPCHGESGTGDGPDAPFYTSPPRNLREGFLSLYSTDDLVRRIREGRSLQIGVDLKALRARATDVESVVSHLKRLPAIDWRRVEAGWETYVDRCEVCHGPYGRPGPQLPAGVNPPRDLSDPAYQRATSDGDLQAAVRHGRAHMPALVPRIPEGEALQLVAFVRLLSPGFELYSRHCAACHGDDGHGVGSLIETIRTPTVVFDRKYFERRDPEQIRDAVWHMLDEHQPVMPHFHWNLSEGEARAIVEYLKKPVVNHR